MDETKDIAAIDSIIELVKAGDTENAIAALESLKGAETQEEMSGKEMLRSAAAKHFAKPEAAAPMEGMQE